MKHQWVAYVIVALLSIGAGVAIAGLPNNVPVDATIIPPETTDAPDPTVPDTTDPQSADTDDGQTVETTTTTTSSTTTTTEPPVDTTEPEASIAARDEVAVVAVNGADIAGAASRMAARLGGIGYANVTTRDGTEVREFTWVYYQEGFEESAARVAADLELLPDFIAPVAQAPQVLGPPAAFDLMVYIGADRA